MNGKQCCLFCLSFALCHIDMMVWQNLLRAGTMQLKIILFDLHRSYLRCEGMMKNTIVQEKQQVVQEGMVPTTVLHWRATGHVWLRTLQDVVCFASNFERNTLLVQQNFLAHLPDVAGTL